MGMDSLRHRASIALVFFLLSASLTLLIISPQRVPTGDEPYYLLTTHSLVVDGDISIGENHKNQEYRLFYPGNLPGRATVGADGVRVVPAHGLGLSLFLVPFYSIAVRYFPDFLVSFLRLVLCGVTSLCVFFLVSLGKFSKHDWHIISGVCLASPFLFYSNLFYPEIFGLLLIVLALREFLDLEEHPMRSLLILAMIPSLLVWFHPKYLPMAVLILVISFSLFALRFRSRVLLPIFYLFLSVMALFGFFWFLNRVYGSWSPDIIYGGDRKETGMLEILKQEGIQRLRVMARMFLGFWVDQRFGILPYAPLFAAALPAAVWALKNRVSQAYPAMILFAVHNAVLCWSAPLGGFAPPSRHFVVMIPFLVFLLLTIAKEWTRGQRMIFLTLQFAGWLVASLMLIQYRLIYTNVTWRNPNELSPFWQWLHLERWIPQMTMANPNYTLLIFWVAGMALVSYLLYPRRLHGDGRLCPPALMILLGRRTTHPPKSDD